MSGIGVILNPHSKKYKKNPEMAKKMSFIVGDRASCHSTETLDDLKRTAREFKERDIDILAISGGDGTIHCTLTAFINEYGDKPLPRIALLRGGTLNTIAFSKGLKGTPENILSSVLVKYHENIPFKTRELQLMKVNEKYGTIFGMGVIYNFMTNYYSNGSPSALIAVKTLVQSISSALINGKFAQNLFNRFDAEVIVNGKKWPFANYSALYAGSINQLGLNFRVFYLSDELPDIFHAVGFAMAPRDILSYIPKMYLGKPCGSPDLIEEPAKEMIIKLKKPLPYTIDGDMLPAEDTFHISVGPKVTILVS